MTAVALHPVPRPGAVVAAQLRAVGAALLKSATIMAGVLLVVEALILLTNLQYDGRWTASGSMSTDPRDNILLSVILGVVAAVNVWRGERPSRRSYHLAMPVARGPHTLAKLFAGWVWLLTGVAALLVVAGVICAVVTHAVGQSWVSAGVQPWHWMVPFGVASVVYFLASVIAVASDHPWAWGVGTVVLSFAAFGTLQMAAVAGPPWVSVAARTALHVFKGEYGVSTVISGRTSKIPSRVVPRKGQVPVVDLSRDSVFVVDTAVVGSRARVAIPGRQSRDTAHAGADSVARGFSLQVRFQSEGVPLGPSFMRLNVWLRATLLWLAVGIAGSCLAAYRQRRV